MLREATSVSRVHYRPGLRETYDRCLDLRLRWTVPSCELGSSPCRTTLSPPPDSTWCFSDPMYFSSFDS